MLPRSQHASKQALEERYGNLVRYRTLKQGDNTLSFYRLHAAGAEQDLLNE